MAALRINILSNYVGQIWMALMGVAFIPFYIRVLGMEAFGLVGLMLSIQALSMMLDLGMGGALNRELARRVHDVDAAQTSRDLVRTFEWLVWPIATLLAMMIWLASGPLSDHWLHPVHLSHAETAHAVAIMGLAVALQWPSSFYANGLSGLERQPVLSLINAGFATLRGAGVLAVLYWVSPTISAFMWWYGAMGACQSLVSAAILWRVLPANPQQRATFRIAELHAAKRFAGGLVIIMALSVMVTQLDRVVISAVLPLAELGYFSLAMSVAAGMSRMIQPMFNALYPRYSRLVSLNQKESLSHLYHLSNQCLAAVVAAMASVLMIFGRDVLYLWTGDASTAAQLALPMSILVAGTALNGMMNLPYALQLAHGQTRLAIGTNLVALVLGIPFCIWAVEHHGIVGAACLWLAINLGFAVVGIPLMHRRLLRGELARWYVADMLPSAVAAAVVAWLAAWLLPALSRSFEGIAQLTLVSGVTLASATIAAPLVRQHLTEWFATLR